MIILFKINNIKRPKSRRYCTSNITFDFLIIKMNSKYEFKIFNFQIHTIYYLILK
jgi:hypothetical protein